MKAKKRFYWFGVLMFNNGEPWPSFVDNRHLPDWAISQMQ